MGGFPAPFGAASGADEEERPHKPPRGNPGGGAGASSLLGDLPSLEKKKAHIDPLLWSMVL